MSDEGKIIFTRNGRPLMLESSGLFSETGTQVAQVQSIAYDRSGRYVGTIDENDRLVYRMEDSATIGPVFVPAVHAVFEQDPGDIEVTLDEEPALPY
jgi:hypothetical protein